MSLADDVLALRHTESSDLALLGAGDAATGRLICRHRRCDNAEMAVRRSLAGASEAS